MNCFVPSPVPLISTHQKRAVCEVRHAVVRRRGPWMTSTSPAATPEAPATKPLPAKRLCIFSDGSWNTPEMESLSNVATLAQAVEYAGPSGVPQIVCYDQGVGTEGDFLDQLLGGAIGTGIDLNIKQLYTFLVMNYIEGDEIYMFGFSRGAYTIRSLAGMMHESGLLYRNKLDYVAEAYTLYRENKDVDSPRAQKFRAEHGRRVPIKLIACFDTVGALGIPSFAPFPFNLFSNADKFKFHDTKLSPEIENAIHVMGTDEDLIPFEPTPMSPNPEVGDKQLTQVFMPGRHGGVGGGTLKTEPLARNAAVFVLEEMERRGLKMDVDRSALQEGYVTDVQPSPRAPLFNTFGIIGLTMGRRARKIPSFESLHPTVLEMYRNLPKWRPASLEPFKDKLSAE